MQGGKKRIVAKSLPIQENNLSKRELWATICYYYPQYTLEEASKLTARDIKLLLKIAERNRARDKYDYVQIVAAPHTKKGSGIKKLTEHFKQLMN